jgi:hypothetical protein
MMVACTQKVINTADYRDRFFGIFVNFPFFASHSIVPAKNFVLIDFIDFISAGP